MNSETYFKNKTIPIYKNRANISNKIQSMVEELQPLFISTDVSANNMRTYSSRVNTLVAEIKSVKLKILADIKAIQNDFNQHVKDVLKVGDKSIVNIFLYSKNGQVNTTQIQNIRTKFQKRYGVAGNIVMKTNAIPVLEMNRTMTVLKEFAKSLELVPAEDINKLLKNQSYIKKGINDITQRTQSVSKQLYNTVSTLRQRVKNGSAPPNVLPLIQKIETERSNMNRSINAKLGATVINRPRNNGSAPRNNGTPIKNKMN